MGKLYRRANESIEQPLRDIDSLRGFGDGALAALAQGGRFRTYARRESILWPGEGQGWAFLICAGLARAYRLSSGGKMITLCELGAGEVIPLVSKRTYIDAAVRSTTVCRIRRAQFESALLAHPELAAQVNGMPCRRVAEAYDRMEELAFHDVKTRLASTLGRVAKREEQRSVVRATDDELACLVVTSRQQVTEWLTYFRTQGWVQFESHRPHGIELVDVALPRADETSPL